MSSSDHFAGLRHLFEIPTFGSLGIDSDKFGKDAQCIYWCGNSLGLLPKATRRHVNAELDAWAQRGVEAHFNHPDKSRTMWMDIDLPLLQLLAPVVGANIREVAAMGSLTANLNALLISFYKPQGTRTKILFEKHAFPSDYYAFLNMVQLHGYDQSHLIQVDVPPGETYVPTQSILLTIDQYKDEIALVCLPGIQFYTGQLFDIEAITNHAQSHGIVVCWDLAHAVGNVPLHLHDWKVDFAVWCSYKYLNAGPGAIGGIFVHENHTRHNSKSAYTPRLAGWWGNNPADRFKMLEVFDPIDSALSYRQSNPSVLDCVALHSSLLVLQLAGGLEPLRKQSLALTGYLESCLKKSRFYLAKSASASTFGFKILTPDTPAERGCQISVLFQPHPVSSENVMELVNQYLHAHGIICDERRPDVIRLAPVPLYNTLDEVRIVCERIEEALTAMG